MANDPYAYDDDEADKEMKLHSKRRRFGDFDCPSCAANNPRDEKFGDGDEVMCYYCGTEFHARVSDDGRLSFREI